MHSGYSIVVLYHYHYMTMCNSICGTGLNQNTELTT